MILKRERMKKMEESNNIDETMEDVVNETPEVEIVEDASEAEDVVIEESVVEEDPTNKEAEYLERLQRLMAEFDNFRKRSDKEKADSYDFAVSNTVTELLPVIDNFERALNVQSEDKSLYAGVEMIYKQLLGMLEKLHVTPIDAEGKEFDPNMHNAILHVDDENYDENIVVKELQKGYLYKEKVIRHSLVQVAN